jgi:peptide chain release factor 1
MPKTSVVAEQYFHLTRREADQAGAEAMLAEARTLTLAAMAEEEIDAAKADIAQIDEALQLMIPKDLDDKRAAFVEIAPALATTDRHAASTCSACTPALPSAALADRDHQRIAQQNSVATKWCCCIDGPPDILGVGVYGKLRFESGGHRVQRVPATETRAASTPAYGRAG